MPKLSRKSLLTLLVLTVYIYPSIIHIQAETNRREQVNYPNGITLSGATQTKISNANVTVNGWISLRDDAILTFENCIIRLIVDPSVERPQESDITLQDRAKLIFSNCSVTLKKDLRSNYYSGGSIYLNGTASLSAVNTSLNCTDDMNIICSRDSELNFDGVIYTGVPPRSSLHYGLEDYTFENLLSEYHEGYSISGSGKSRINIAKSRVGRIGVYGNSTLAVEDSRVVYFYEGASSEKSSVVRSSVEMLYLSRYNASIKISGLVEGYHARWDSYEFYPSTPAQSGTLFVNSTLENLWLSLTNCETELIHATFKIVTISGGNLSVTESGIWLLGVMRNSHSTISGSNLNYLLGYSDEDLDLTVSNTKVSTLLLTCKKTMKVSMTDSTANDCYINHRVWTSENGEVNFTRTAINNLSVAFTVLGIVSSRSMTIRFEDCLLTGSVTIWPGEADNDELNITGSLRFGPKSVINNAVGPNRIISRSYDVRVIKGNEPLKNVTLKLVDANRTLWEAKTDEAGSASINLRFADPWDAIGTSSFNITSRLYLCAEYDGDVYSVEVGLLSDTPIEIKVRLYSKLQADLLATAIIAVLLILSISLLRKTSLF